VQVQLALSETTAHASSCPPVCTKRTGRGCAIRLDTPRRLSARPCLPPLLSPRQHTARYCDNWAWSDIVKLSRER
jgi:hypothetical protein